MNEAEEFLNAKGVNGKSMIFTDSGYKDVSEIMMEFKYPKPKKKTGFWDGIKKGLRMQG